MKTTHPQRATNSRPLEYLIRDTIRDGFPWLTPNHHKWLAHFTFALLTLKTFAQSQVSVFLARCTATLPNTWRQRLKRLRQHPWDTPRIFRALLRMVVEQLRPEILFLALDTTTLRQDHTVLTLSVLCHATAIPIAWQVVPATQQGRWNPLWRTLLKCLRGVLPAEIPVLVFADRGLWSPQLFRAICANGWHPLMRVNAQGKFRLQGQVAGLPLEAFCPARGTLRAVEGWAFGHRLSCTLVVFWGLQAEEAWYLLTDLPAAQAEGSLYGLRSWIEQGFRTLKRGGLEWHRTRVVSSERVFLSWWVYALGLLLSVVFGLGVASQGRLWDKRRRSVSVFRLGWLAWQAWVVGALLDSS